MDGDINILKRFLREREKKKRRSNDLRIVWMRCEMKLW